MSRFVERKLVLLVVDLAGYARWASTLSALPLAEFVDGWYRRCAAETSARGGRIVKFMGDACLAIFEPDAARAAVGAARALADPPAGEQLRASANVHIATVAAGDFGPDEDARFDVIGAGVNHLFLMGGAPGIRVSEPVYRQLPNEERAQWRKHRPPATYTLM
jgi:class 3 adenylate cyclase